MTAVASFLLRLIVMIALAAALAGATLTLAAERVNTPQPTLVPVAPAPTTLTVPDVTGQAYVFAKGILQDHGLAWHVTGPVQGYAANVVAQQKPTAGTELVDTGAPTIGLTLSRNSSYVERGTPDNDAPYPGTAVKLSPNAKPRSAVTPRLEPVPVPQAPAQAPSQVVTVPPVTTPAPAAVPAQTTPATTAPVPATPPPATIPTVTPPAAPTPTPTPAPTRATTPTPAPADRSPDFVVAGAPKEPKQAQALPERAQALATWLEKHREPTPANLNYWLYEHAYIVAGAKFGWWHGSDALKTLIVVDQRAEVLWGVGKQSELTARAALAEVSARSG